MKPKTLILMVVAVTCGLGASYMTSRLLAERGSGDGDEKVIILVAAKNLDQGATIKNVDEAFQKKEFLRGSEPKDAIVTGDQLKGKVLKRALRAGDFVTEGDLFSEGGGGLSFQMSQGYRAVGVRVNMESTASGFASLPHSRVDIISTVRRGSDKDSFAQVLLENVLVLAVDTQLNRDVEGRAMPGNVVTLALKPEDMLKVAMAKELGPLSLALRKFKDESRADVDKVTVQEIITNTAGKHGDTDEEVTGQPPLVAKVDLPKLPKDAKVADIIVTNEEPKNVFRLRILEGDKEKVTEYLLDKDGQPLPREVSRTEVLSAPPRPTPAVTPSLTPPRPEGAPKD